MYKRKIYDTIIKRLGEQRMFIQVIMGPRQIGKSTVIKQVLDDLNKPFLFYSADTLQRELISRRNIHSMVACRRRFGYIDPRVV